LSALERLKNKVKDRETLIEMIEKNGKDKTSMELKTGYKELKTGYKTLEALIKEWKIDASFLSAKEQLKCKIGNRENLQKLVNNYSLTKLEEKFQVGRNTVK